MVSGPPKPSLTAPLRNARDVLHPRGTHRL